MSESGQNRKSSMRAYVFRCSPNNGHRQDTSAGPFRASSDRRIAANLSLFDHLVGAAKQWQRNREAEISPHYSIGTARRWAHGQQSHLSHCTIVRMG